MVEFRSWDVPAADRFDRWCDSVTRDRVPARFISDQTSDFRASATTLEMGQAYASVLRFPGIRCERTPLLIRRSDPELWELGLVLDGETVVEQNRSQVTPGTGDLVLYDTSRPFVLQHRQNLNRVVVMHLSRRALPVPEQALRDLVARPLPSRTGLGAVVAGFLAGLAEQAPALQGEAADHLGTAAVSLASAYFAHLVDGAAPAPTRQVALRYEIKTFIGRNLNRDLSPAIVAATHHISVRYLHHLFREEERSVSEFIREQRLDRCRTDLADSRLAGRSVAEVGARWGFTDPATFNRAFKEATGLPPGEYRRHRLDAR